MPRKLRSDPDTLLGRVLRLAAKDIRRWEALARARAKAADFATTSEVLDSEDRKALIATGEFLRKVAADTTVSDKDMERLVARLNKGKQ